MNYQGSCHCGRVAVEVEGDLQKVMSCNCSMCQRKGALHWFVPRGAMTLKTPEGASKVYEFNKHVIKHHFCPECGIHVYGEGKDAKGNVMAAVNARCLENVDLDALQVQKYDGRSH